MTFIDRPDSEGIFGLLLDCIADERAAECREDPERERFRSGLLARLEVTEGQLAEMSPVVAIRRLRSSPSIASSRAIPS